MNSENVKSLLIRDRQFLKTLYDSGNSAQIRHLISTGDDTHLNTLIKYLHFVTSGQIFINKENFSSIEENKKLKILTHWVEKKSSTLSLINGPRINKVKFLLKLSNVYTNLLFGLFNLEKKLKK